MAATTADDWAQLVSARTSALGRWSESAAALAALPATQPFDDEDEASHEQATAALNSSEDKLLAATPPDLAAAALQVKLFAERFHATDVEGPPMTGEDRIEGAILRRLYGVLGASAN